MECPFFLSSDHGSTPSLHMKEKKGGSFDLTLGAVMNPDWGPVFVPSNSLIAKVCSWLLWLHVTKCLLCGLGWREVLLSSN